MMMKLPPPPELKTTIIQLNKDLDSEESNSGYEILTNEYNAETAGIASKMSTDTESAPTSPNLEATAGKKKRRRSTANINSEELAKRKHETKQLHSIIEKRRRIKINREFEALKYLIPACRNWTNNNNNNSNSNSNSNSNESGSSLVLLKGRKGNNNGNSNNKNSTASSSGGGSNNGGKIDGMYKLTILKSSVEYILYLHHIIQKQHELLSNHAGIGSRIDEDVLSFDIDFAKIPLNVNQYRNIDIDFSFRDLMAEIQNLGELERDNNCVTKFKKRKTHKIVEEEEKGIKIKDTIENEQQHEKKKNTQVQGKYFGEDEGQGGEEEKQKDNDGEHDNNDEADVTSNEKEGKVLDHDKKYKQIFKSPINKSLKENNSHFASIKSNPHPSSSRKQLLPTPEFTPDIPPEFSIFKNYTGSSGISNIGSDSGNNGGNNCNNDSKGRWRERVNSNPISPHTSILKSTHPSPFSAPLRSTSSNQSSPLNFGFSNVNTSNLLSASLGGRFTLPDPAVNPSLNLSEVPRGNEIFRNMPLRKQSLHSMENQEDEETKERQTNDETEPQADAENNNKFGEQYASKTLLSLKRSSIDHLLN
ncbi:hypothetical protein LELG_03002 [Lodderomyces elongisporus NRRL YB-4239]|uniref:BHLH domain-containing protein n=1 Tax=Lodderomyces elongisporus (strain ATCC 11503 / CBS 2605 / JCM 1781 / NBRC 1676 / NRRL YB-4239) TaxID=379508 RepID=A5E065_LODEL|nr:hypothetical protein LELG_03002 [Lodderomyces elongisporus NRRL YB-4239]